MSLPPLAVITVASNKGGVGKTTLATNLAVYLRALREDLPILVLGLDDQDLIERMFSLEPGRASAPTLLEALHARALAPAVRIGQYGVHWVPPSPEISNEACGLRDPHTLGELLVALGWNGVVVIDTKSDLGILTRSALLASDLALLVVSDQTSLDQAERVYALFDSWGKPSAQAPIVLSLVDRRVKYRDGDDADVLALLLSEIRQRGRPCLETFLSRSPKIAALATHREKRVHAILHGTPGSLVHRQMGHLAQSVLEALARAPARPANTAAAEPGERRRAVRRPFAARVAAFTPGEPPILALDAVDLCCEGMAVAPNPELGRCERLHLALAPEAGDERLLVWASVARRDADRVALRFELGDEPGLRERLERLAEAERSPPRSPASPAL